MKNKMFIKKVGSLFLIFSMMFSMVACSKSEPEMTPVNINVKDNKEESAEKAEEPKEEVKASAKEIADSLLKNIAYKDELTELDLDTAAMFFNFDGVDIEEAYIYESSGATAEEIVVLKCKDEKSAKAAKAIFENRVNEQIESYESYVPEEVPKLNKAVIAVVGDIAVLSVSDDAEAAKKIIG